MRLLRKCVWLWIMMVPKINLTGLLWEDVMKKGSLLVTSKENLIMCMTSTIFRSNFTQNFKKPKSVPSIECNPLM